MTDHYDVFLSYNTQDKAYVLDVAKKLIEHGLKPWLDDWDLVPGKSWQDSAEIIRQVPSALVFMGLNGRGPWQNQEIKALMNRAAKEKKFPLVPVILPGGSEPEQQPLFLEDLIRVDLSKGITEEDVVRLVCGVKGLKPNPDNMTKIMGEPKQDSPIFPTYLSRLPTTNTKLFGRNEELDLIDVSLDSEETNILGIIAMGGQGKTALVNEWMNRGRYKAMRAYGWSFYSQGAGEHRTISAEPFLQDALRWFGQNPDDYASAHAKGDALAEAICEQPTLLVLDGLEPLQYPPGVMEGLFKDQGLQALLRGLARRNQGLCLISSREPLTDLKGMAGYKECRLGALDTQAGLALLKHLGVTNHEKDIQPAVEEYGGHALALNLLGEYTAIVLNGDVRRRDEIPELMDEEDHKGRHAWRVMAAYAGWLGGVERELLRILGLFDRPADWAAIEALRDGEPIVGLTEALAGLDKPGWKKAVKRLEVLGLTRDADGALDCHPLVREYFGRCLRKENEKAWREAHRRLFVYFKNLPEKDQPDTLEEMEPLFRAVAHGCLAGLQQDVEDNVFWTRIRRKEEQYTIHKLGAFGSDLAAVACFFEHPWSNPSKKLDPNDQAVMLSRAGFGLRALGRPAEAVEAMEASVEMAVQQEEWKAAAIRANNLSELELARGVVERAVEAGRRAVAFADQSGVLQEKLEDLTTHAEALARLGRADEAAALFEEAEVLKKKLGGSGYLISLPGFRYGDLLLEAGKAREVRQRAEKTLLIPEIQANPLSKGLDQLNLGRAAWALGEQQTAQDLLEQALETLLSANTQDHMPRIHIARAGLFTNTGAFEQAQKELDELKELLERTSFNLFWVDYHHQAARFALAQSQKEAAQEHIDEMARWIEETGYGQRLKNLDELRDAMFSD